MTNKKVPAIRFNGFTDEWGESKLGDVATFSKGSGYSKKDVTDNGTPIILYGQLYTNYQTIINTVTTFVMPKNKSVISEGDEVIVPASGENSKDISRASVIKNKGIILGGDLNIINPYSNISPVFLALTISHGRQQTEMLKRARGTTIIHLYNSDLKQVNLIYPSLEEQTRIGSLFSKLDKIITNHEKQLDYLQTLKKASLQRMFPRDGESKPEVRFEGFTNEWVETKLGDVTDISTGKLNANAMVDDGIYDFYTSGMSVYKTNTYTFEGPAITIAGNGYVGSMHIANGKFDAYQRTYVLLNFMVNQYFLYQTIDINLSKAINTEARGGTISYIVMNTLTSLPLLIPSLEEQERIGNFFKHLDDKIKAQETKIEQLKLLKKGLLQHMFI